MTLDLNSMSRKELQKLRRDVDKAIATLADREKKAALDAAEKAAAAHGFTLAELAVATKKGRSAKSKAPAKYRNPEDPSQTWTGKGRQPEWFKAGVAAGKPASAFEI